MAEPRIDPGPMDPSPGLGRGMRCVRLIVLLLAASLPARAEIFKCADPDGNVTYTNAKQKGCTAMDIEPYRDAPATASRPRARTVEPAPANFPSVDRETQKRRDQNRRHILETELAGEERLLADARRFLAEGDVLKAGEERNAAAHAERVRKLKETVRLHEQNVAALRRELANAK